MNLRKVNEILESGKNGNWRRPDELLWQIAICNLLISNIQEAYNLLRKSFFAMLKPPMIWSMSAQPNHLVQVFFLSCEFGYKNDVINNLINYRKKDRIGDNFYANVAFGLMGLHNPELEWTSKSIEKLLSAPEYKDTYNIGTCIQAIEQFDQTGYVQSLHKLLDAHKAMATRGSLRGTPEGWLCMPAMVLIYLAELHGMKIRIENDYVSNVYIDFMISLKK
jgi:hypothetical protein